MKNKALHSVSAILKKLDNTLEKTTVLATGGSLKRLFTAWLCSAFFYLLENDFNFTEKAFYTSINLPVYVLSVIFLWFVLWQIKSERFVNFLMIGSASMLGIASAYENKDFIFLIGLFSAVALVIYFADPVHIGYIINAKRKWILAVGLMLFFTLFVGLVCCLYYRNHWTSCFDFGIFSQSYYYLKETGLPLTTCERDGLLSHFAVHFSPVMYLLLPIYFVFPTPETLLISQSAVIASGIIPLLLICKHFKLTHAQSLMFAVIYTMYPCLSLGCSYYFHENCFLAPFILWLVYFCEKERTLAAIISALLLLSVKEDASVYTAVIGLYYAVSKKNVKCSLSIVAIAVAYFLTATYFLASMGDGVMTWRYKNYMYDNSGSLISIFKSIASNPVYTISQCFTQDKLTYILQMLLPLGFMPFMMKKPKSAILLIPFVLVNLMTDYGYQYNINFQYSFGSGCLLIVLAVMNFSKLKEKGTLLLVCTIGSVVVFTGLQQGNLNYYRTYRVYEAQRTEINNALELIPDDAVVASSTFFVPELSQRDEIYELETTKHTAEYYVIDLRFQTNINVDDYKNDKYEELAYEEGVIAIYRAI